VYVNDHEDAAIEFLLGATSDPSQPQESIKRYEFGIAFDYALLHLDEFSLRGKLRYLPWNRKFVKSCKTVHDFVDEFVVKAQAEQAARNKEKLSTEKPERYVFLDELVQSTNDPIQIRDELLSILLAGRDTTAGLLTNTFHILAKNPEVWLKLRSEVQPLNGRPPTYEDLKSFRYLKQVIDESKMSHFMFHVSSSLQSSTGQRLFPVVPANARFAINDTFIPHGGGPDGLSPVYIAKGGPVGYNTYVMHRDPKIWGDDAAEFKPERWDTMRQGWHYLPFNGG